MSLLALLAADPDPVDPDPVDPDPVDPDPVDPAVPVPLYPGATPQPAPAPLAAWNLDESAPPYLSTAGDLPLNPRGASAPVKVTSAIGDALWMNGENSQELVIPALDTGRLHIGGNGGTAVSVSAEVYLARHGQVALAGIWGEFADPPQRQYALFYDLPAYGGDDMSCFHVSKDGAPTPGYPYSTDYSANPIKLQTGRWYRLAGTYDGTQAVSYLNGEAFAHTSGATRTGDGKRNPYTFLDGLNSTPFEFAVATGGPLSGMIRNVQVWNTALTPGQVLHLHTTGPALPEPPTAQVEVTFEGAADAPVPSLASNVTFTALPIGTPRSGRLVVIGVAVDRSSVTRKITAATINGTTAAFTNPTDGNNLAFVHAVIPTGSTIDLDITLSGDVSNALAMVVTLDGADPTPVAVVGSKASKSLGVPASTAGGVILGMVLPGPDNPTGMSPVVEEMWDARIAGVRASMSYATATGYFYPMAVSRGSIGSYPTSAAAIAFNPA